MSERRRPPGRPRTQPPKPAPVLDPDDQVGAGAVMQAYDILIDEMRSQVTRDGAAVRLVTNSALIAQAWRALHGADAALPHNPGFAHCARRYMAMGEYGTALALIHRAQHDGWADPEFEALAAECESHPPQRLGRR